MMECLEHPQILFCYRIPGETGLLQSKRYTRRPARVFVMSVESNTCVHKPAVKVAGWMSAACKRMLMYLEGVYWCFFELSLGKSGDERN